MAPHNVKDDVDEPAQPADNVVQVQAPPPPPMSVKPPRLLVIGAGSRGCTYAQAALSSSNGVVVAIAEPDDYKRRRFGERFIWGQGSPTEGSEFQDWRDFITWEISRREREKAGEVVPEGVDAAFVCVLDEMHRDVVVGLAPLDLHLMCEKPLATTLTDCVSMYRAMAPHQKDKVFSIGHVLRYSPHNMMLRKLLLEDKIIGEILSIAHTEPVGWWHFSHSYVRGNWRKESTTAPSLLTKSCHDIDVIMWLLCSPPPGSGLPPHLPTTVSSTGSLQYFKKSRKPKAAGNATNCLSCPIEQDCMYSSKRIYVGPKHMGLETGNTSWPVSIVMPDIESFEPSKRQAALIANLGQDYDEATPKAEVAKRNWFGRCVWEADNDVCDEQVVTMTWDEEPLPSQASANSVGSRGSKQATFHMVASTKKQCERYTYLYGTEGEIYADSQTITVEDFRTGETKTYRPRMESLGHGGGDIGLARQFIQAVDKVKNHGWAAEKAQDDFIGCSLEEIVRSHAVVFAAEEARTQKKVVDWKTWWDKEVGQI